MKNILIWGFYKQGNLGDDLMAAMFYEIIEDLGHNAIIYSDNPRIQKMGYKTSHTLGEDNVDGIIIGGGAFLKQGRVGSSQIERSISDLSSYIKDRATPTFAASIGSDGVERVSQVSSARRSIIESSNFRGGSIRLISDRNVGLKNSYFIPDVVLGIKEMSQRKRRLKVSVPEAECPEYLINLSRRSALQLPRALWKSRKKRFAFFQAHTGETVTGGEIKSSLFPTIDENCINKQLGYLSAANRLISSKLHPGIISMSFGNEFEALAPRPKTSSFLKEVAHYGKTQEEILRMHREYISHQIEKL